MFLCFLLTYIFLSCPSGTNIIVTIEPLLEIQATNKLLIY